MPNKIWVILENFTKNLLWSQEKNDVVNERFAVHTRLTKLANEKYYQINEIYVWKSLVEKLENGFGKSKKKSYAYLSYNEVICSLRKSKNW